MKRWPNRRGASDETTAPAASALRGSTEGHAPVEIVQGLRAGLAVFATRREDIVRVIGARKAAPELTEITRWAGSHGVPCLLAGDRELDQWAESSHHEGLCVVTRPRRWTGIRELGELLVHSKGTAVALDRVRNPYNVGAILRTAAFFGMAGAVLGAPAPHPALPSVAVRVAEGAAEVIELARTTDLAETLARLRSRGLRVYGADHQANRDAWGFAFDRPAILVLGHEREGLGQRVRAQCDALVAIGGSGRLESLNVAVAAGVLIAAMTHARA
jgi:TrmH RNA methyltransferase